MQHPAHDLPGHPRLAWLKWSSDGAPREVSRVCRGRREPQRQTWRDLVGMASAILSLKKFELQGIMGTGRSNTKEKMTNWFMFDYLNP